MSPRSRSSNPSESDNCPGAWQSETEPCANGAKIELRRNSALIGQTSKSATSAIGIPALDISHVSHSYGKRKALERVSFAVESGSFTVLLGLNGAGKSTLFSLITRLY